MQPQTKIVNQYAKDHSASINPMKGCADNEDRKNSQNKVLFGILTTFESSFCKINNIKIRKSKKIIL